MNIPILIAAAILFIVGTMHTVVAEWMGNRRLVRRIVESTRLELVGHTGFRAMIKNLRTAEHYRWGDGCDSWRLLNRLDLNASFSYTMTADKRANVLRRDAAARRVIGGCHVRGHRRHADRGRSALRDNQREQCGRHGLPNADAEHRSIGTASPSVQGGARRATRRGRQRLVTGAL